MLIQEVRALGELEKKLRTSRQLLFSGEQELRDLHSHLSEVRSVISQCVHSELLLCNMLVNSTTIKAGH